MSKFSNEVSLELLRTENMLKRSKEANNLRDRVSRAYYACYHAMIAAIWLAEIELSASNYETAHLNIARQYKSLYTRTKNNNISSERDVQKSAKEWKKLRCSADYDIFTDDFEQFSLAPTKTKLERMYKFVDEHIAYIKNNSTSIR